MNPGFRKMLFSRLESGIDCECGDVRDAEREAAPLSLLLKGKSPVHNAHSFSNHGKTGLMVCKQHVD